jgi:hypothetical protein
MEKEKKLLNELLTALESYKANEHARTQTFFYGLIAVGVFAFFKLSNHEYCQSIIIFSFICGIYGFYCWYYTEMVNFHSIITAKRLLSDMESKSFDQGKAQSLFVHLQKLQKMAIRGHLHSLL